MGRPRRPYNGVEEISPLNDKWMERHSPRALGVRVRLRWRASQNWAYRVANGVYDPLTYLLILDTVASIDPNIELRAKKLVDWLNVHRTQFVWDAVTVGRILMDLRETFEDVLGPKMGLLESGSDYRGNFWRIHHNADTALLYQKLRSDLYDLAEVELRARSLGHRTQRLESPLLECASVRQEWVDPNVA